MVFVQLISCLLPFLYSVLKWSNQPFHESTTATRGNKMKADSERMRDITNRFIYKTLSKEWQNERKANKDGMRPGNTIIPSRQERRENCCGGREKKKTEEHRRHLLGEVA